MSLARRSSQPPAHPCSFCCSSYSGGYGRSLTSPRCGTCPADFRTRPWAAGMRYGGLGRTALSLRPLLWRLTSSCSRQRSSGWSVFAAWQSVCPLTTSRDGCVPMKTVLPCLSSTFHALPAPQSWSLLFSSSFSRDPARPEGIFRAFREHVPLTSREF